MIPEQELLGLDPHVVQHVQQFVIRLHQMQLSLRMPASELNGKVRWHRRVVLTVKNDRGLPDLRIVFVLAAIFDQLIAQLDSPSLAVMEHFQNTAALPLLHGRLA